MTAVLALLILLEIKHFIFDFVFQTPYQFNNKGCYGHPGGLLHVGQHGLGTAIVLLVMPVTGWAVILLTVFDIVIHYHIDWFKEQLGRRVEGTENTSFWMLLGLDQMLHHLTYFAIAGILIACALL